MKLSRKRFRFIKTTFILVISILLVFLFFNRNQKEINFDNNREVQKLEKNYYPTVENETASINKYYIYGRSFNIEGVLNEQFNKEEVEKVFLVLKTDKAILPIETVYDINNDNITFKTSTLRNDGIILDDIELGNFFILLNVTFKNDESKYYTLDNKTKNNIIDYYSISNNEQNKYVTIDFVSENETSFMKMEVVNKTLPDDVYDIVIDPGHGGIDPGATYGERDEAPINLTISKKVKEELEKVGFKVKLTRDGNYNPGHRSGSDPYGLGGRVGIPFEAKAKYMISIHVNYDDDTAKKRGLELYMANESKFDLARQLVDNIIDNTSMITSNNMMYRKEKGIYVRTLLSEDIELVKKDAQKNNFQMYDIKSGTPYYFIIRETGGSVTNAYVDGRNPKYSKNEYYDSNIGVETYIIELGYINNDADYKIIIQDQDGYAKGIAESFEKYIFE